MAAVARYMPIAAITLLLLGGCAQKREIPLQEHVGAIACLPEPGSPYHHRKVVQVVGTMGAPDLPRDLPGIAHLTSQRLQTHLEAIDRFQVLATHETSFDSMTPDTVRHVRALGQQYASQFVVKIELLDMTTRSSGRLVPLWLGDDDERNVELELSVHDTEFGALFFSRVHQATVTGDVLSYPGGGRIVDTSWFETDVGKTVDIMLRNMSHEINEALACVPFSTKVTAVEGGSIRFDAGHLHGISPGETMRIYPGRYTRLSDGTRQPVAHKLEEDAGWITIDAVYPNHSVASRIDTDAASDPVRIGDRVRAW